MSGEAIAMAEAISRLKALLDADERWARDLLASPPRNLSGQRSLAERQLRELEVKREFIAEYEKENWVMEQGHRTGWTEGGQAVRETLIRAWAAVYDEPQDPA